VRWKKVGKLSEVDAQKTLIREEKMEKKSKRDGDARQENHKPSL